MDIEKIKKYFLKILLYYSFLLSLTLFIAGISLGKSARERLNAFLFLPVVILNLFLIIRDLRNKIKK